MPVEKEQLQKIQDNTKELLKKYPEMRKLKNRKEAIWIYYKEYENLKFGITKTMWLYQLTNPETISRAIRKCQELNPNLRASEEDEIEKQNQSQQFAEFYKQADEFRDEFRETLSSKEKKQYDLMFK